MRVARCVFVILCVLNASPNLNSQQTAALQRDVQAISLLQQCLATMGGAEALLLQDSVAIGEAQTFLPDGTTVTLPIVKKSKGTKMVRTELQRPEGTRIRVVNGGVGGIRNSDGTIRKQFSNNTAAERVEHIPVLSILSEWQSSSIEIRYIGADIVNGSAVQVVAISFIPTSDPQWISFYRSTTQKLFYIDQGTNLVSKIQYQNFAEKDSNVSEKVEVFFSDYRSVSGVLIPFKQASYADGRPRSTLIFNSMSFNNGLLDTEFAVPGGN